jgi:ketosteroid isomerase-like protein
MISSLSADMSQVSDIIEIQQMIARYAYTFDRGDAAGWADVFTPEGVWEMAPEPGAEPSIRLAGRDELMAFCTQRFSDRRPGLTYAHHQSGVHFTSFAADMARAEVMLILTISTPDAPPSIFRTGVYHDAWRRTGQGWRLQHRLLTR